jgi:tetratricopeptide (TPR) repeat protein
VSPRRLILPWMAALLLVAPIRAFAEPDAGDDEAAEVVDDEPSPGAPGEARARELAALAQRHFDLGEYDEAIAAYRAAYRHEPRPGLLYNLGQAYRLAGDCVTATTMYRNYLRLEPATRYRALVEEHLEELAPCTRERIADGATPASHEGASATAPPAAPAAPRPRAGPVEPPVGAGRTRRQRGLVVAGGGVLLAGAGAYFALDARRAAGEVSRGFREGGRWEELAAIDARGRRAQWLGAGLLAAGGAALVTGTTLYWLGRRDEQRAFTATLVPAPGAGTVVVAWRF